MAEQKDGKQSGEKGFAAMDKEQQREIASKGGEAAHKKGSAHEFDEEEAREAGRKGGQARGSENEGQGMQTKGGGSSERGGSSEQHAKAGSQSHKND